MKFKLLLAAIFSLLLLYGNESYGGALQKNEENMRTLVDGLDLEKSIFNGDLELKKYRYSSVFIEDILISELLDEEYLNKFMNYLNAIKPESKEEGTTTLLTQLLIIRLEQLQDTNAFNILSILSKDEDISYNGIELFDYRLVYLFLENPTFYLKESCKYNSSIVIKNIISDMGGLNENYLLEREGNCSVKSGMILVFKENIDDIKNVDIQKKIQSQKLIKAEFNLVNPIKNETSESYYYDIHPFLNDVTKNNLDKNELKFYTEKIQPLFDEISIHNYHAQDKDGYVNIRKKANVSSDVVGIARNGEYVCFVSTSIDDPNWVYIKYEGIHGYVHKSRLVRQ